MDWRKWKLDDWNRALIKKIFLDPKQLKVPVTRIQASGQVLAEATGAAPGPDEAWKAFILCFGTQEQAIRGHFSFTQVVAKATERDGIPSIFAALYLSLLAARADEATHDEGNFRKRFKELLHPVALKTLPFEGLPRLWEHLQEWTISRARRSGDCRQLLLPDVSQHDCRIGYSKRLAFPTYRDEIRLADVLAQATIDQSTELRVVARELSARQNEFSQSFKLELSYFVNALAKSNVAEAVKSPLWATVESITWAAERAQATEGGTFYLGVDVLDFNSAELYLVTDGVGKHNLGPQFNFRLLPGAGAQLHIVERPQSQPWTAASLIATAKQHPRIGKRPPWRYLGLGLLTFFPDERGNLTTAGEFAEDSPLGILAAPDVGRKIAAAAKTLGIRFSEVAAGIQSPWMLMLIDGSTSAAAIASLARSFPTGAALALRKPWRKLHPTVAGAAWFGQSMLLNPASRPSFAMAGSDTGVYTLEYPGQDSLRGALAEAEGRFSISSMALIAARPTGTLTIDMTGPGNLEGTLAISVGDTFPLAPPAGLKDSAIWLVDGPYGSMASYLGNDQVPFRSDRAFVKLAARPFLSVQANVDLCSASVQKSLDALGAPLGWICEALCVRYQRRSTLGFTDVKEHVVPACEATGTPPWMVRKLLLSAGWLIRLEKRSSPFPLLAAGRRSIAMIGSEGSNVRLVGMFSSSERSSLENSLLPGERAWQLGAADSRLAIGAIEMQLSSPGRIDDIAVKFSLDVLAKDNYSPPFQLPPQCATALSGPPIAEAGVELVQWNRNKHCWERTQSAASTTTKGIVYRMRGQQRDKYYVSTAHGAFVQTDSAVWAFIFGLSAHGLPIGTLDVRGDCAFSAQLPALPPALAKWWLHWGGGHIGVCGDGKLIFGGASSSDIWKEVASWLLAREPGKPITQEGDAAGRRRQLALRLRSRDSKAALTK